MVAETTGLDSVASAVHLLWVGLDEVRENTMKKTIIISALVGLAAIILSISISSIGADVKSQQSTPLQQAATTLPYPDTMTLEIEKNKKILKEKLEYYDISAELVAKDLYTVGVKEIKTIRIDVHEKGDEEFGVGGAFKYLIVDSANQSYYVQTNGFGGYLEVQKDGPNGEYLIAPRIFVHIDEPPLKWWQKQPNWIQWLLRYICFGWIWMK